MGNTYLHAVVHRGRHGGGGGGGGAFRFLRRDNRGFRRALLPGGLFASTLQGRGGRPREGTYFPPNTFRRLIAHTRLTLSFIYLSPLRTFTLDTSSRLLWSTHKLLSPPERLAPRTSSRLLTSPPRQANRFCAGNSRKPSRRLKQATRRYVCPTHNNSASAIAHTRPPKGRLFPLPIQDSLTVYVIHITRD